MDTRQVVELLATVACILATTRKSKYGRRYGKLLHCLIMHRYTVEMWPIILKGNLWDEFLRVELMDIIKPVSSAFCDATEMYCTILLCMSSKKIFSPPIFNKNFPYSSLHLCGLGKKEIYLYMNRFESVHHSRLAPTLCNTNAKPAVSNWWWLRNLTLPLTLPHANTLISNLEMSEMIKNSNLNCSLAAKSVFC